MNDVVAESGLAGDYDQRHIEQWHSFNSIINWPNYFIQPFRMMVSIGLITLISYGLITVFEKKFSFVKTLYIIICGYFIFLIDEIAKFIWFVFLGPEYYTLRHIREFSFLSALNFFNYPDLQRWEVDILHLISIPLLLFVLVTANGFYKSGEKSFGHYSLIVSTSLLFVGLIKVAYAVLL